MGSWVARLPAVVLAGSGALALAGCSTTSTPAQPPPAPPTPITRLNTAAMAIPRIDFCSLLPRTAVRKALGTRRWDLHRRGNGDTTTVGAEDQRTTDVVAEHGCSWRAGGGLLARADAWVFARPVDDQLAREVVRQSRHEHGCRDVDGPRFGDPTLTQVCRLGTQTRVRHAGLFGDTWLTCQVTDQAATTELQDRADAWCVQVVNALNTNR